MTDPIDILAAMREDLDRLERSGRVKPYFITKRRQQIEAIDRELSRLDMENAELRHQITVIIQERDQARHRHEAARNFAGLMIDTHKSWGPARIDWTGIRFVNPRIENERQRIVTAHRERKAKEAEAAH